jgi:hypothetical protein
METFEVHITGDESIIAACEKLKTIAVDLLRPDLSVIRTEYMTSYEKKAPNYDICKMEVHGIVNWLNQERVKVHRIKIESPVYAHYIDRSWYIESHFDSDVRLPYPLSRNQKKTSLMGTDRVHGIKHYDDFMKKWEGSILEICLYDTFVAEDKDWFEAWGFNGLTTS